MGYTMVIRHIDGDETEVIKAKNKDDLIDELLWILQRAGFYTNPEDSDY